MIFDNNKKIYTIICIIIFTSFYIVLFNEFLKFRNNDTEVEKKYINTSTNSEIQSKYIYDEVNNVNNENNQNFDNKQNEKIDNTDNNTKVSTYSEVNETEAQAIVAERIQRYKDYYLDTIPDYQKVSYNNFIESIKNKENFQDKNSGWINLKDTNDKLIIGCSTAVWCGYTIKDTELEKYKYDVIGLGGAFDSDLKIFLENLDKKKYKRIVIFGGVNDVNLRAFTGEKVVDINFANEIGSLVDEARNHLENGVTELIFVRVKPMTYGKDSEDIDFIDRFNVCANQYNDLLTYLIGVKYYDIPFDTSEKYSAGYVHYDEVDVYKKIFDDINELE